jgi:hypothetical protein
MLSCHTLPYLIENRKLTLTTITTKQHKQRYLIKTINNSNNFLSYGKTQLTTTNNTKKVYIKHLLNKLGLNSSLYKTPFSVL